jgi:N-terminal acetyltransferase B complex non-catalytic subunit
MGCSYGKASAMQELNQIIKQIGQENSLLEKERDKLKGQHYDRPDDENDNLQDLRIMHNDLEREIKELKELLIQFIPPTQITSEGYVPVKIGIEKITEIQKEIDEKSNDIREMILKREELKKEQEGIDDAVEELDAQISELEIIIENQESTLRDQGNVDEKLKLHEKERSKLADELKKLEKNYKNLSEEVKKWEGEEKNAANLSNVTFEYLSSLSEADIAKEIKIVEKDIENLSSQVKELEQRELDLQEMDNYLNSVQSQFASNSRNGNVKQQILENQEIIEQLKEEKKKIKEEFLNLKRQNSKVHEGTTGKIQALNNILEKKDKNFNRRSLNDLSDVEETLKKAKQRLSTKIT